MNSAFALSTIMISQLMIVKLLISGFSIVINKAFKNSNKGLISKGMPFFETPCIFMLIWKYALIKADFLSYKMLCERLLAIAFFWNTSCQARQISIAVVDWLPTFQRKAIETKSIMRHLELNGNPPFRNPLFWNPPY